MMIKTDKTLYKALKFFSGRTLKQCNEIKEKNPKKYYKYVPKVIAETLSERSRFVDFNVPEQYSPLALKGTEQLRILEEIKLKERYIWISIIALFLSILALIKSFGVF